ncbi:hypothetical protein ACUNV4_28135 [Granulosicoccus sp. 3-233]|uniref:hypothetical protein n=1 Tax=Granulosicoccus sp. 3-233 TaxID=3417969 RepID=UPI003D3529B8
MDRLEKVEEAVLLLTKLSEPGPRSVWDKLCLDRVRDLLWVLTIPTLLYTGVVNFDRYWLSRSEIQNEEKRNIAIARLDLLQDINSEIYQLQTRGEGRQAFALIEAKRGQIARLTDTIFLTWAEQPEMLERYDLIALAEALLVQYRTDDALRVAETVETDGLTPIDAIDQLILKARIQFEVGPAQDLEAARDHLRKTVPLVEQIQRRGNQLLMQEKVLQVSLLNEGWLGVDCDKLLPMAEGLMEVRALNKAAGSSEDVYQSETTVLTVRDQCS